MRAPWIALLVAASTAAVTPALPAAPSYADTPVPVPVPVTASPGVVATSPAAGSPMAAASALAAGAATSGGTLSVPGSPGANQDQTFLTNAVAGAQFEILAGQVAQQRAGDQRIRTFAAQAVADHGAMLDDLSQLTQALGVSAPAQPTQSQLSPDRRHILAMWGQLSGAGFDCSYASTEYLDHTMLVAAFQDEANHGVDPKIHLFAVTQLPGLQSHLNTAGANLDGLSCGAAPTPAAMPPWGATPAPTTLPWGAAPSPTTLPWGAVPTTTVTPVAP